MTQTLVGHLNDFAPFYARRIIAALLRTIHHSRAFFFTLWVTLASHGIVVRCLVDRRAPNQQRRQGRGPKKL
jgi:hypothetical protein